MYVLDKYKSQGIGKKLVSAAYEYLSNQPYENLIVWTLVDNIAAINFYKSVGLNTTEWRKQTEVGGKFYEEIALLKSLR